MKPLKVEKRADEVIAEGHRARAILRDPVVIDAFEYVETQWTREWRDAKSPEARERCWALIQALAGVKLALGVTEERGEIESRQSRMISNR